MSSFSEAWLIGPSDTNFYTRTYEAADPKALIVYTHGAAEHAGRHEESHAKLAQKGITVFVYDLRGFGRTALDKEHRSAKSAYGRTSWKQQLEDSEWAVKYAHEKHSTLPIFLMGFSLGAGIVLGFVTRKSAPPEKSSVGLISGVIGVGSTLQLTNPPPVIVYWVARLFHLFSPYAVYPAKNDPAILSRNPDTNAAYLADPLVGSPGSLQSLTDMLNHGALISEKEWKYWPENMPVLFLHGTDDRTVSHEAAKALYEKLATGDKQFISYPDGRHELHNEPDGIKEKFVDDVVAWINAHV